MGALVGFASEDTENFLFLLTYTQKNATAFGKKTSNEVVMRAISLRFLSFLLKGKKATHRMHRWVIAGEIVRGIFEGGRSENRGRCRIVR